MKTRKKQIQKLFLKENDVVQVISGKDKGKQGKILKVDKKNMRVYVEGVAMQHKHQKPTKKDQKGQIREKEGSIHYSNILLYNSKTKKGERVCMMGEKKEKKRVFISEKKVEKKVEKKYVNK